MSKALFLNLMAAIGLSACGGATTEREVQAPVPAQASVRVDGDAEAITGCVIAVDHPHRSMHKPATVNVVGRVKCNRAVEQIEMKLGLMFNGVVVAEKTFTTVGSSELKENVSAPCINGIYNGGSAAKVTFPPPSFPEVEQGWGGSGDVSVTACPN